MQMYENNEYNEVRDLIIKSNVGSLYEFRCREKYLHELEIAFEFNSSPWILLTLYAEERMKDRV